MLCTKTLTWWTGAVGAVLLLASGLPVLAGKPPKGPSYSVIPLEEDEVFTDSFATDINGDREIVGYVRDPDNRALPVCWITSEVRGQVESVLNELTLFGNGGDTGVANSINQSGEIVGVWTNGAGWLGVYWHDYLGGAPRVLPPLDGDDESGANAVNNDGVICGTSTGFVPLLDENSEPMYDDEGNALFERRNRAVAWRVDVTGLMIGPFELPTPGFGSLAAAINNNDETGSVQIVGAIEDADNGYDAVVWTVNASDGTLINYDVLDIRAMANGVNNSGTVCGNNWTPTEEAILWNGNSTLILDRGRSIYWARANELSDNGVIVGCGYYQKNWTEGTRAVAWPDANGSMSVLAEFLGRDSTFATLTNAAAVNGPGEIVGSGLDAPYDGSSYGAFLAIPK